MILANIELYGVWVFFGGGGAHTTVLTQHWTRLWRQLIDNRVRYLHLVIAVYNE